MMSKEQSRRVTEAFVSFFGTPLDTVLDRAQHEDPREAALALFHDVVATVPAYPAFLAERGVDPGSIRTADDLCRLPPVTKASYILQYRLPDLCRGGRLEACDMIAVSSGSTGKPTFWPRFVTDELVIARRFEQAFRDAFSAHRRRTLAVICFALGTWVGGMFTAACCRHLAAKGYPITVITPGNNKEEILRVVNDLGPRFDQVVLLGYPPFLKDVIDAGIDRGVKWPDLSVRVVTAGEVFSEAWRTLVAERIGSKAPAYDFASLYGTADAGVLGVETPLSIAIRRFLADRPDEARAVFGQDRLPTLVQYDPFARYFEVEEGKLIFTGDNGIPLVRYDILDTGGVIPHEAMMKRMAGLGFDAAAALPRGGARVLPFVFVFGRFGFHRLVLRRQRVSGERHGGAREAGDHGLGHRQVRDDGGARRRRERAPRGGGRAAAGAGAERGAAARGGAVDRGRAVPAQQRVPHLRARGAARPARDAGAGR
ncbi:MAG: phenylacetate--CoA ligase family protein [Minicystis sp.]